MKLLITTQVVDKNDPDLGFFLRWIEEFAKHCENVEVICLYEGEHSLPKNVHVHSLGKEKTKRGSIFLTLLYIIRFRLLNLKLWNKYDAVFVHMNPEYIILDGPLWRISGKRVGLWYLHRSVNLRLRIAEILANVIFTASKESFRLKSNKVQIVGHGIDTAQFRIQERQKHSELRILTTGRVAPAKRIIEMLDALDILHARGTAFHFTIAGGPGTPADKKYAELLQEEIAKRPYRAQINFVGAVSHDRIPSLLAEADVFLNLSTTGSLDKAVLEAFASGIPAVTSNEAFRTLLEPYGLFISIVGAMNPEKIADALVHALTIDPTPLRTYVENNHSLTTLVPRILNILSDKNL